MKYHSQGTQLTLDLFRSSLDHLDKSNRWVKLGDTMPWDKIEKLYSSKLNNQHSGASGKPARMIIGALIIKHRLKLSDRDTILMIKENPYMQYFVGLTEFSDKEIFHHSLFTTIRQRLGADDFNAMSVELLRKQVSQEEKRQQEEETQKESEESKKDDAPPTKDDDEGTMHIDEQGREHKGYLKVDATCADAEMRYPTDINLLHDGCRVLHEFAQRLSAKAGLPMPQILYGEARKAFLKAIKRKRKGKALMNETMRMLLKCLDLSIRAFWDFIAKQPYDLFLSLRQDQQRCFHAIIKMYEQQKAMFYDQKKTCADRIVSIFQPHVRPIVRGKARANVEFGAKIGASIVQGYTFIDHHSWDAYNEASDLRLHVELYKQRFGCLPRKVFADMIYLNRENRKYLKDLGIEIMGKPLGRPSKQSQTPSYKASQAKAAGLRNEIEATFGTSKRCYDANDIRAKRPDTAECWNSMCYFAKNVMKFLGELLSAIIEFFEFLCQSLMPELSWRPCHILVGRAR